MPTLPDEEPPESSGVRFSLQSWVTFSCRIDVNECSAGVSWTRGWDIAVRVRPERGLLQKRPLVGYPNAKPPVGEEEGIKL